MRSLRNVLVVAVALAASSAAPTGAQQKEDPVPASAPDAADRKQETMRETMKDLLDENVKLRKQNLDLRKDNDALKRQVKEYEQMLRQLRANPRIWAIPPQQAPQQGTGQIPRSWRPFEFNGMTYYVVPLKGEHLDHGTATNAAMEVAPARPAAQAK